MQTFADKTGRQWSLELHLGMAMRIKGELGVDLLQGDAPDDDAPNVLTRLMTDPMRAAEVIRVMIADQFEAADMTADQVLAAFDGATIQKAHRALVAELSDFCRSLGREDLAEMLAREAEAIRTAIQANLATMRAQTHGDASGCSPGGSGSTREG